MLSKSIVRAGLFLLAFTPWAAAQADPFNEHVRPTEPLAPEQQLRALRVPSGFEVQLVASEPQIAKPMNLAFDARGRIWITESREYPFPARHEQGRDAIKILEDTNGDGRADKVTTFAEGLNIPLGVYPYKDGCIAFSIPYIYYFRDLDGDDRADRKEVLYGPFGFNDTHGMTNSFRRGFDGWLYATHGFNNTTTLEGKDGSTITMHSGNVYRMQPDGSRVEQFVWGPVNPFGMTIDAMGDIYVADCHSKPILLLLRGGWYPHFGNPHDGLGFAPYIMEHLHGSTAIAGVAQAADERWPEPFRDNFFVGNVVTSRVNRDSTLTQGSTRLMKEEPDFVICEDPWFRPVDVQLGPDGALYIADFYNRIIGHYEVPLNHPGRDRERGRVWRIIWRGGGAAPARAPDLSRTTAAELVRLLAHANMTVRMHAADQLVDRIGTLAIPELKRTLASPDSIDQKAHALWALKRLSALDDMSVAAAATDSEPKVRVHVMRILAESAAITDGQHALLIAALKDQSPLVQRTAAEALGRHRRLRNVRPLLELRHRVDPADPLLLHTVRMAIRDHFREPEYFAALPLPGWSERDERAIIDVALSIPSAQCAAFLLSHLGDARNSVPDAPALLRHAARHAAEPQARDVVAVGRARAGGDMDGELALLNPILEGTDQRGVTPGEALRAWAAELAGKLLDAPSANPNQTAHRQRGAAELARSLKLSDLDARLARLLAERNADPAARGIAAKVLLTGRGDAHTPAVARILVDATEPAALREQTAQALAEAGSLAARAALLDALAAAPGASQLKLAVAMVVSREGAESLLDSIAAGKASPRLLLEPSVKERLNAVRPADLDERIAALTQGLPPMTQEIQNLIDQRLAAFRAEAASAEDGAEVFTANCAACHSIGGQGGLVAPQLDGIGARGLERLVEDILDPNRNIDPAFFYSIVPLADGDVITGLYRRDEGELVVFADATGEEIKVPRQKIRKRVESRRSLMPDNFHELLSPQEFNDMIAYLLSSAKSE